VNPVIVKWGLIFGGVLVGLCLWTVAKRNYDKICLQKEVEGTLMYKDRLRSTLVLYGIFDVPSLVIVGCVAHMKVVVVVIAALSMLLSRVMSARTGDRKVVQGHAWAIASVAQTAFFCVLPYAFFVSKQI